MEQITPMMRQYLDIKKEYADALLFFRLGDFYELFFEDALTASRELEITLTGREGGGERIPMCGVPHHSADGYIKRLIENGYKVAICDQMEDPKQAKGVVRREVTRVITPGTLIDQSLLDGENHYLASVVKVGDQYGVAFCDLSTGQFDLPVYPILTRLSLLEELIPYAPRELLIPPESLRELEGDLTQRIRTSLTPYREPEGEEIFHRLFPDEARQVGKPSGKAASLLLAYLEETQKRSMTHLNRITLLQPKRHMVLDPFTRRNLELTETIRTGTKEGSLLFAIDRTVTSMGRRGLRRWLDKPLLLREEIEARLDAVQYFVDNPLLRDQIRSGMKEVYDLERLIGRIAYGNVNGRDLAQLRKTLGSLPSLLDPFVGDQERIPAALLFHGEMAAITSIFLLLERALVDDPPVSVKEGGLIRDGYHEGLDRYREASRNGKTWIASLESKERERTGIRSLKVGFNKVFGYYIEVTKANLSLVPEDYERKQTLAQAERYVTPELKEKESFILEAEEKMGELEYSLFQELREHLLTHIETLQEVAQAVVLLDLFSSFAELAVERGYTRPRIGEKGFLSIKQGRHPVIEQVMKEPYIANDTRFDDERKIYLITGPNMAGKSTYMRQVALIQLLFQIGSFVPAEEASLPIVDRIFTRIGAADDLVEGSSTFMVEMNEVMVTTSLATERSMVIIDELGRGTSTQDGMAIAQAVIEYLHDKVKCITLVSTHFHELASLEASLPRLRNYHMAVKEKKKEILFTRQLIAGSTSNSYGIYCAYLAGIPRRIIERANELLLTYEEKSTALQLTLPVEEPSISTAVEGELRRTSEQEEQPGKKRQIEMDQESEREKAGKAIIEELSTTDLNRLPPIEALLLLRRWQEMLPPGEEKEEASGGK